MLRYSSLSPRTASRLLRFLASLPLLLAGAAQADYTSALRDYDAKKFPEAFAELKRLAELGDAPSQRLLTGDQCEKDVSKGLVWLTMAAQQGHSDAQFVLALRLARGEGVQADPAKALHWLKASSESGHSRGKLHYALHLLISGGATPAEALAQLPAEDSKAYNPDDIGQLEVRALAAAMNGDFATAVRLQETVLAIATELGFSAEQRQRWLDSYRQQQLPGREELRSRLLVAGL